MVIATVRWPRYSFLAVILASIATLALAPRMPAQAQASNATNSSSPLPSSDAAAKAAERKKRFEEEEKRLENAESAPAASKPEAPSASPDDMSISPVLVNMLVHETQGFSLFDNAGHNLTSKAEWTLSNSYVADLSTNGIPTITSKDTGAVTVYARVGSRSTEASVTVLPGDTLPIGTIRWQAPKVGNLKAKQIVIAVPSSGQFREFGFSTTGLISRRTSPRRGTQPELVNRRLVSENWNASYRSTLLDEALGFSRCAHRSVHLGWRKVGLSNLLQNSPTFTFSSKRATIPANRN